MNDHDWIPVHRAAELANRGVTTIYLWIRHGRLRTRYDASGVLEVHGPTLTDVESKVKRGRPRGTARPRALYRDTP